MTRIKMHISKMKLPFYPSCEIKCWLQNRVSNNCQLDRLSMIDALCIMGQIFNNGFKSNLTHPHRFGPLAFGTYPKIIRIMFDTNSFTSYNWNNIIYIYF